MENVNEKKRGRGRPKKDFEGLGLSPSVVGGKVTRMYRKWSSMKARCYQESHPSNGHYRGKGIEVDARWLGEEGFQNFCRDMGECPPGLTLERVDGRKGYGPGNCKWATWKDQAANRKGVGAKRNPGSLMSKAREAGVPYMLVYHRVRKLGWDEESALSLPRVEKGGVGNPKAKEAAWRKG